MKTPAMPIARKFWIALNAIVLLVVVNSCYHEIGEGRDDPRVPERKRLDMTMFNGLIEAFPELEEVGTYADAVYEIDENIADLRRQWDFVNPGRISSREKVIGGDLRDALAGRDSLVEAEKYKAVGIWGPKLDEMSNRVETPEQHRLLAELKEIWVQRMVVADGLIEEYGKLNPMLMSNLEVTKALFGLFLTAYLVMSCPLPMTRWWGFWSGRI